jgi:hypothetical protein
MTPSKRSNMTTRLTVCEVAANENPDAKVQGEVTAELVHLNESKEKVKTTDRM